MSQRFARMARAGTQVEDRFRLQPNDVEALEQAITDFGRDRRRGVVRARGLVEGFSDLRGV